MRVTVCIASIGRQSLLETLDSIAKCRLQADVHLDVVIADDSQTGNVQSMLERYVSTPRLELAVVTSASANIATARNACLSQATGDYLAFIDDDEVADESWLFNYIELANSSNADAIFGPVNAIYPEGAAQWICDAKPFVKRVGNSGDLVDTGSTCNAFVRKDSIDKWQLSFRPDLGKSGGEDTAFFAELHDKGGMLIASNDAMVIETVPVNRLTVAHLSRRNIRGGQTYAHLFISPKDFVRKVLAYGVTAIKVLALAGVVSICYFFRKDIAFQYAVKLWLNVGKLRNLLGMAMLKLY